jgi:hypothetical protein
MTDIEKQLLAITKSMRKLIDVDNELLAHYHKAMMTGRIQLEPMKELTDDRFKQARLIMLQCEQLDEII